MRLLVTGAAGFIGTQVVRRLVAIGHHPVCLDRDQSARQRLEALNTAFIAGDVTDRRTVLDSMAGCDGVVHLAGIYSFWERDRRVYAAVNVEGTRTVMECALAAGVAKVIHVSTSLVFGRPLDCPFTEGSAMGPVRFSEYARTKYRGDEIAWQLHAEKRLPLVVLYPASVVGAGDDKTTGRYIQDLVERRMPMAALSDCIFTFVHVDDVAAAIVSALEKPDNSGEKYLVGKQHLSVRQASAMAQEIAGVPLPRLTLSDRLVMPTAALLTAWADVTGRPPPWGMSVDQARTMRAGLVFDGSKAERELGIVYTPVRAAIEDAIAALRVMQ